MSRCLGSNFMASVGLPIKLRMFTTKTVGVTIAGMALEKNGRIKPTNSCNAARYVF